MANIHGRFLPMAQYRGLRTDCGSGGACSHARPRKRIRCGEIMDRWLKGGLVQQLLLSC